MSEKTMTLEILEGSLRELAERAEDIDAGLAEKVHAAWLSAFRQKTAIAKRDTQRAARIKRRAAVAAAEKAEK